MSGAPSEALAGLGPTEILGAYDKLAAELSTAEAELARLRAGDASGDVMESQPAPSPASRRRVTKAANQKERRRRKREGKEAAADDAAAAFDAAVPTTPSSPPRSTSMPPPQPKHESRYAECTKELNELSQEEDDFREQVFKFALTEGWRAGYRVGFRAGRDSTPSALYMIKWARTFCDPRHWDADLHALARERLGHGWTEALNRMQPVEWIQDACEMLLRKAKAEEEARSRAEMGKKTEQREAELRQAKEAGLRQAGARNWANWSQGIEDEGARSWAEWHAGLDRGETEKAREARERERASEAEEIERAEAEMAEMVADHMEMEEAEFAERVAEEADLSEAMALSLQLFPGQGPRRTDARSLARSSGQGSSTDVQSQKEAV